MNRAKYHDLTRDTNRPGVFRLNAKHPETYLTSRLVLYTDLREFGLHEADVMQAIERRHVSDIRSVCNRLAAHTEVNSMKPEEMFEELLARPLIDWVEHIPNPEEFTLWVGDVRLLDELIHDRVHYEVELDSASTME